MANTLANILSNYKYESIDSYSQYNPVFKFDYTINGKLHEMNFTSVTGHMMNVEFEKESIWELENTINLFTNPIIKKIIPGKEALAKNLQVLGLKADLLVLWLDCDREGENIAFEVVECVKTVNPKIKVLRAKFSALTHKDIEKTIKELGEPDENLSNAVDCRQKIDLLIGAVFTRIQTLSFRDLFILRYRRKNGNVISYGPCQFPTLNFVVERANIIENFKKEAFHYLELKIGDTDFEWKRQRLFDEQTVTTLYEKVESSKFGKVNEIKTEPVTKYRPVPLNTVEFQKLVSRKLKFSSHYAMQIAELLYQKGYISYPRTETQKYSFSEISKLKKILQELGQESDYSWCEYAKGLVFNNPRNGKKDDKAHPPIHPVKFVNSSLLDDNHKRIYDLIVSHFLASISPDATGYETSIEIIAGEEVFQAKGLTLDNRGFFNVFPSDFLTEKELPKMKLGQIFYFNKNKSGNEKIEIFLKEGTTTPPHYLNEAELITLMDKFGIGTDSTIHEHIKKIQDRGYAVLDKFRLMPTVYGHALIKAYQNIGIEIYKPYLRAQMEKEITEISLGKKNYEVTYESMKNEMFKIFQEVYLKLPQMTESIEKYLKTQGVGSKNNQDDEKSTDESSAKKINNKLDIECPECKIGKMRIIRNSIKKTYFLGCNTFPKCRKSINIENPLQYEKSSKACESCSASLYNLIFENENKNKTICLSSCFKSGDDYKKTQLKKTQNKSSEKEKNSYSKKKINKSVVEDEINKEIPIKKPKKVCELCKAVGKHSKNNKCKGEFVNPNKDDFID